MGREYQFERSLGMLSRQISKGLGKQLQKSYKEYGIELDPTSWSVLSLLKKYSNRSQQDIVNFLWIDKVKVKRVIDKLENSGLVRREIQQTDKRYNLVKLTDKGIESFDKVVHFAEDALNKAFKGFSKKEKEQLIDSLIRVKKNLETETVK